MGHPPFGILPLRAVLYTLTANTALLAGGPGLTNPR